MVSRDLPVAVQRWQGGQHPSLSTIMRIMKQEGLRPYMWSNLANHRYGIRSHNYDKILFVIDGSLEIHLPDSNSIVTLRTGDRITIPAGVRHMTVVGATGAKCVEASMRRQDVNRSIV